MKKTLFNNLTQLKSEISVLNRSDKDKAKQILITAAEITDQFNKGKLKKGSELDLDEVEIVQLSTLIEGIWTEAAVKNIEVWPKPDIVTKVG